MADSPVQHPSSNGAALAAARDAAVVCDLSSLSVLGISGADAAVFLQGQLSSDVDALGPDACQHTSYNSPKGRMLANFVLWRNVGDGFQALLPADIAPAVAKRLSMYVLRSKVVIADVSAATFRCGVGGPGGADAMRAAMGVAPAPFELCPAGTTTIIGLPGPRFVVLAPAAAAVATWGALTEHAVAAGQNAWEWLTIRAGAPVVTAATQDAFVAQTANWEVLGGVDFRKGCYTGQEIIARTQHLGRLKERTFLFHVNRSGVAAGERIFSAVFGEQPCGTVVNAAPAPGGGCDLLAVLQIAAADRGDTRLGAPDGPALLPLPLPYALPTPVAPRGRIV